MVRRLPIEEGTCVMGQPGRVSNELAPEVGERIRWLRRRLLSWFEQSGRSFLWREPDRAPYEVVVAEVLLQRTTAVRVARAYPGFIEHFPSWTSLAQAPLECLESALRPLGLWRQKTLAFPSLAQSIVADRAAVPTTRSEVDRLPAI